MATLPLVCLVPPLVGRVSAQTPAVPVSVQADVTIGPYQSDGNGVFEPGETVIVQPSWMANQSGPLSGWAIDFSGPVGTGTTYSVVDGTADYGVFNPGSEVKSCIDTDNCYLLSVAPVTPRPLHWDATFTERAGTQTHNWTIHLGNSFADVPHDDTNPYYRSIETLLHSGVIGGCGNGNLCPKDKTSRAQMAVLALASKGISPPPCLPVQPRMFYDVSASSPFCRWIEELARRGLARDDPDQNPAYYRPSVDAKRKYMAYAVVSLARNGEPPPPCGPGEQGRFEDVIPSDPYCPWVEELSRVLDAFDPGILLSTRNGIGGCTSPRFCPDDPPFREEATTYEVAMFDLKLNH